MWMQAIILCGGLASRLGNTTRTVPKILLDIAGKTVLEWQIQLLKDANVEEVILALGHLHDVLYERVGVHYAGVGIDYAKEEKTYKTFISYKPMLIGLTLVSQSVLPMPGSTIRTEFSNES
ncbi:hypothetical protein C6499_02070 [Candidatus Poribacteria bacterium]|nr:MAG: hypothetical protein C6499_02070 [Candidatus Poribacteria bacterium]